MNNTVSALIGGVLASAIGIISAWISANAMRSSAQIQANKDIRIQREKSVDARVTAEAAHRRMKLEELHVIVSRVAWENSQTVSYLDQVEKLDIGEFRKRYKALCSLMFSASAIVDMYYPSMSTKMSAIVGKANLFWGSHDALLQADPDNGSRRLAHRNAVGEVAAAMSRLADEMHDLVSQASADISHSLSSSVAAADDF
jgi:hypothetical protein